MLYKLLVIIILIILFYLVMSNNIETFVDVYDNKNKNNENNNSLSDNSDDDNYIDLETIKKYTNKNEYSMKRFDVINSSIPYDIVLKNDKNKLYDYGNDEINEKLNKICEIDHIKIIKMVEGIKWSKWYKPNTYLNDYYNKFILFFMDIIQDEIFDLPDYQKDKYEIYQHKFMKYKFNKNARTTILLNVELVIYRNNRPLAKHLKVLVITNGIYYNIILAKVIGVIRECDLNKNKKIDTYNNIENSNLYEYKINDDYDERYVSKFKLNHDMNSFIFDTNEKLEHSRIEYNMYNKLFKDL